MCDNFSALSPSDAGFFGVKNIVCVCVCFYFFEAVGHGMVLPSGVV